VIERKTKKTNDILINMSKNKTNLNRSAHKKLLKEQRLAKLEKQLKTNILKRKKAIKLSNG
tara:strand:- start:23901 stop:24083 length:183 start_codon:yes stop_codon:yes gene_type:complete